MIVFFKKIRQRLLSENQTGKYLKYAIGEILLVVIGILIALQINNWNQGRVERIAEIAYLKGIKKEILINYHYNTTLVSNRFPKKIDGLKLAIAYSDNDLTVTDTLDFLNKVTYGGVFSKGYDFGARNTYDEVINTGSLQLFQKDTIKTAVADYYAYIDVVTERTKVHSSNYSNYTSELSPFDSENPTFISKTNQILMMESFKSVAFKKLINLELSYAYKIRDYINMVNTLGEEAIRLINQELKDN